MIKHIVLLKMKSGILNDRIEEMYKNLFQLRDSISNILSISGGKNNSPESKDKGFSESFVVEFENKEARNIYLDHQEHKKVAETYILPIIDDIIVFDYEY